MMWDEMADLVQNKPDERKPDKRKIDGDALWRYRIEAGLSQEQLAKKSGVAQGAISMIEKGERTRPYPSTLKKLADALGVQIRDLLPSVALLCATGMPTYARRGIVAAAAYVLMFGPPLS
jgi:transcriptional regulator with XRE-family HTH domain